MDRERQTALSSVHRCRHRDDHRRRRRGLCHAHLRREPAVARKGPMVLVHAGQTLQCARNCGKTEGCRHIQLGCDMSASRSYHKKMGCGLVIFRSTTEKCVSHGRGLCLFWLNDGQDIARGHLGSKDLLPFPTEFVLAPLHPRTEDDLIDRLIATLSPLNLDWSWDSELLTGLCSASGNVWSRAARRRETLSHASASLHQSSAAALAWKHRFVSRIALQKNHPPRLHIRWLRGLDHVTFESFVGMIKRAIS